MGSKEGVEVGGKEGFYKELTEAEVKEGVRVGGWEGLQAAGRGGQQRKQAGEGGRERTLDNPRF